MQELNLRQLVVYPKDLQVIAGCNRRGSYTLQNKIKAFVQKTKEEMLTLFDVASYYKMNFTEMMRVLTTGCYLFFFGWRMIHNYVPARI